MQRGSGYHFTRVVDDYPCLWREFEPADLTQPRCLAFRCQLRIDVSPVRGPVMVEGSDVRNRRTRAVHRSWETPLSNPHQRWSAP